jgi:hypothetical protein
VTVCDRDTGCYFFTALFPRPAHANLACALYFVLNMLFGGVLLTDRSGGVGAIMDLSIMDFAFKVCVHRAVGASV